MTAGHQVSGHYARRPRLGSACINRENKALARLRSAKEFRVRDTLRLHEAQWVAGSNPVAPTNSFVPLVWLGHYGYRGTRSYKNY
jgi:hypothetical protein